MGYRQRHVIAWNHPDRHSRAARPWLLQPRALLGQVRRVLLVRDVVAPRRGIARFVDFEHRQVSHEAVGRGAVPVVLARLEEDAVAGAYHLDLATAPLAEADAL